MGGASADAAAPPVAFEGTYCGYLVKEAYGPPMALVFKFVYKYLHLCNEEETGESIAAHQGETEPWVSFIRSRRSKAASIQ